MNKYEAAKIITGLRPDLSQQKIMVGIRDLMKTTLFDSEYYYTQAIVSAEQGEPMPWEVKNGCKI